MSATPSAVSNSSAVAPVTPVSSDQLAAYNSALTSSNPIQMTPGGADQGMVNFFSSPEYQAMYGSAAGNMAAGASANSTYNPVTAYQSEQDPAYQYNMNMALAQTQNASAAKGLLQSGATQRDLLTQAQGMQNQGYQTWLGQQNTLFNNYQTQLQGLTNTLPNINGSSVANSNAQSLAGLQSGNIMTGATGTSANQQSTGQNISQLFANNGAFEANAQMATGAAQSNNVFQGLQFQAQLLANQSAANANAQNGQMAAQGNQAATNSLGSSGGF